MPLFIVGYVCIGPWLVMKHKAWYKNSPQAIVSSICKIKLQKKGCRLLILTSFNEILSPVEGETILYDI